MGAIEKAGAGRAGSGEKNRRGFLLSLPDPARRTSPGRIRYAPLTESLEQAISNAVMQSNYMYTQRNDLRTSSIAKL